MKAGFWFCIRRILFLFDAESVHRVLLKMIRWAGCFPGRGFLRLISGTPRIETGESFECLGLRFSNRVGLAAGFDKDAEIVDLLPALGFGFAEVGTVTLRPQPGNPRPRLYRDLERGLIFNRMGFNSAGADDVASRLRRLRSRFGAFPVGVNLGKNKDTPAEAAASDYAAAASRFEGLADYFVINVSSPNTPGLRDLQTVKALDPIVRAVHQANLAWSNRPPILLKLAPELGENELRALAENAQIWGIAGWVLTNTLLGQWGPEKTQGGWSGQALKVPARDSLVRMRKWSPLPIISVGGVMSVEEAQERLRLGAQLVQVYTGWVFEGPGFPAKIARGISENQP